MKNQSAIVFLMFCLFGLPVAAQPLPVAKPETVGMSSERLNRIGETLRADIAQGRMPGAVVAIARKGKLVYYESFGYLDKAAGIPMPKDAIFSIASMTKPMAGVGAMILAEQAKLFINDPVAVYLPAFGKMQVAVMSTDALGKTAIDTVPTKRGMTVLDLMRHTSGLLYGFRGNTAMHKLYPLSSAMSSRTYTGPEFLEKLTSLPLMYQPGTTWDYSLSIDVLGLIIESITKQSLGQFLDAQLFKPLGMMDTGFVVPPEKVSRYAKALPNDPDTGRPQSVFDLTTPTKFECAGGCSVSTAGDYLRFAQMLLDSGKLNDKRILSRKSVELMTADQFTPEIQNNIDKAGSPLPGYSFGLTVAVRPAAGISGLPGSIGDFTWVGAFGTSFWVDKKEQLVIVFMTHTPGPTGVRYLSAIKALALQAIAD